MNALNAVGVEVGWGGAGGVGLGLSSNAKPPGLVKGKQQDGARCEAQ